MWDDVQSTASYAAPSLSAPTPAPPGGERTCWRMPRSSWAAIIMYSSSSAACPRVAACCASSASRWSMNAERRSASADALRPPQTKRWWRSVPGLAQLMQAHSNGRQPLLPCCLGLISPLASQPPLHGSVPHAHQRYLFAHTPRNTWAGGVALTEGYWPASGPPPELAWCAAARQLPARAHGGCR